MTNDANFKFGGILAIEPEPSLIIHAPSRFFVAVSA
jgi:hypothetical protein